MGYISGPIIFCVALFVGVVIGVYVSNEYEIKGFSQLFTKISDMTYSDDSSDQNRTQIQNLTIR